MAVKIIKRGRLPEDIEYNVDCYRCKTEFTFAGADARFYSDQRDGDYYQIDCPVCCKPITVSVNAEIR